MINCLHAGVDTHSAVIIISQLSIDAALCTVPHMDQCHHCTFSCSCFHNQSSCQYCQSKEAIHQLHHSRIASWWHSHKAGTLVVSKQSSLYILNLYLQTHLYSRSCAAVCYLSQSQSCRLAWLYVWQLPFSKQYILWHIYKLHLMGHPIMLLIATCWVLAPSLGRKWCTRLVMLFSLLGY